MDPHCHGRDWQQRHKTTVDQVLLEAEKGLINVTAFMPNTDPAIDHRSRMNGYYDKIETASRRLGNKRQQYLYFGVTDDNFGECEEAANHKFVIGYKIYPLSKAKKTVTTGKTAVAMMGSILKVMELAAVKKKIVAAHCDCPDLALSENNSKRAEVEYLKMILGLAKLVKDLRLVICHVSCKESAELILQAQAEGLMVGIELAPHYLWFDAHGTNWRPGLQKEFYKCFNSLRTPEDRLYLCDLAFSDNEMVFIGSDNACHLREEKLNGNGGLPSNQEMVSTIVTLGTEREASEKRMQDLLCYNASEFYRIPVKRENVVRNFELKIDNLTYNNGKVVNPWNGSKLYFPVS